MAATGATIPEIILSLDGVQSNSSSFQTELAIFAEKTTAGENTEASNY
jgi:hypothetical protein